MSFGSKLKGIILLQKNTPKAVCEKRGKMGILFGETYTHLYTHQSLNPIDKGFIDTNETLIRVRSVVRVHPDPPFFKHLLLFPLYLFLTKQGKYHGQRSRQAKKRQEER